MKPLFASLILASIILLGHCAFAQPSMLKGTWITPEQDLIEILNLGRDSSNVMGNKLVEDDYFHLFILKDTLSFRQIYTSSSTDFKVEYVDRYDLKIVSCDSSYLVVKPVSKLSKAFFQNRSILKFRRKEQVVDTTIVFEKLIYEATPAWFSPGVSIKLDNRKNLSLDITNQFYEGTGNLPTGHYTAVLDDSTYNQFIARLQNSSIKSLRFGNREVKDSGETTLDVYFNGQRKYLKSMDTPRFATGLLSFIMCRLQVYPGLKPIHDLKH